MIHRNICFLLLIVAVIQAGCAQLPSSGVTVDMKSTVSYLALKRQISEITEADLSLMRKEAAIRYSSSPSISNQIRLAIISSGPRATREDNETARAVLLDSLSGPTRLSPSAHDFVVISLNEIEKAIEAQTTLGQYKLCLRDLEVQSSAAVTSNQQLETKLDRMNTELADLRQKIRDLTHIERSVDKP
ncbi:MAG: hypothetical protein OEU36_14480 [Gammaproteobacteria bacterium]|nr:hypothetical protein [Gammaproteobacteria bacterium]